MFFLFLAQRHLPNPPQGGKYQKFKEAKDLIQEATEL